MNIVLALAAAAAATAPMNNLKPVRDRWGESIQVDVVQATCGQENAFYFAPLKLVVMCRELNAKPVVSRFVLNHELGHAWMNQHGIPDSERGADELGLLMSTREEALAAADWFDSMATDDDAGDDGSHQAHRARAIAFRCIAYGLYLPEQTTVVCQMYAQSLNEQWTRVMFLAR